jgi:hypothetical protein
MRAEHQLKMQQLLAAKGVGFKTEVFEVKEEGHPLKDYVTSMHIYTAAYKWQNCLP